METGAVRFITARSSLLAVFLTLAVAPLVSTGYMHDDVPNRQWATVSIPDTISNALELNRQWMEREGRFFPGGFVYGISVFQVFDTRAAYMTWLLFLNLVLIGLVAYTVHLITRSAFITAASTLVLGACFQARFGVLDGVQSFAGLVQFTLILTILSGLAAAYIIKSGKRIMVIPLVLAWSWAITSYEVSLLMLPAVILLVWAVCGFRDRVRTAWALGPLIIPAVIQAAITMWLRSGATGGNPSYTTDLSGPVMTTFLKQFSAALPSSQYLMGPPSLRDTVPVDMLVLLVAALAVPAFLLWHPAMGPGTAVRWRVSLALIGAGAWAWVVPALLAGVAVRWQSELQWGQGYIYSIYQYVGVALVTGGAIGLMADRSNSRGWKIAAMVVLAAACVGCAITVGSNIMFASQFVAGPQGPG